MGRLRNNWFRIVGRKLLRSPPKEIDVVLYTNNISTRSFADSKARSSSSQYNTNAGLHFCSREELAATTIQLFFRAHLARRAFRALKSLIKLQALVRGMCVRRQARIALHCMHALARLQITVRARQLLRN